MSGALGSDLKLEQRRSGRCRYFASFVHFAQEMPWTGQLVFGTLLPLVTFPGLRGLRPVGSAEARLLAGMLASAGPRLIGSRARGEESCLRNQAMNTVAQDRGPGRTRFEPVPTARCGRSADRATALDQRFLASFFSRLTAAGRSGKPARYGLLTGVLGVAVVLCLFAPGCQAVWRNARGPLSVLQQSEEPAAPQSLDEWMRLKRMDP